MPSPFRAGSRYPAVRKTPDTAEAPAAPVRTAGSRQAFMLTLWFCESLNRL
jgi:hypothetical protein